MGWDNREDAERGAPVAGLEAERAADKRFPCLGKEQKVTLFGECGLEVPEPSPVATVERRIELLAEEIEHLGELFKR